MKPSTLLVCCLLQFFCASAQQHGTPVTINWVDHIDGDFSFREKWDYPYGVYKNQFGQVSCDNCPIGTEKMRDKDGRIYPKSAKAFYKLLDTSHQYHSISCTSSAYDFMGTDYIDVTRGDSRKVRAFTLGNNYTFSNLELELLDSTCTATMIFRNRMKGHLDEIFYCNGGRINIDKVLWSQGILKATFDFTFANTSNPQHALYWKGRIYKNIVPTREYD